MKNKKSKFPKLNTFEELENTIDSPEYVNIRSYLWRQDNLNKTYNPNPAIAELWDACEHSYSPNPINYDFTISARESILKAYNEIQEAREKRAEEIKRLKRRR